MYQLIYDFILNALIAQTVSDVYTTQLAMILTHTSIVLIYVALVMFIVWVFKVFANIARF